VVVVAAASGVDAPASTSRSFNGSRPRKSSCCPFFLSRDIIPVIIPAKPTGLLLDYRGVDVPMASNLIVVTLSSLKPFFFNSLQ
jgi:hypothetical protein